MIRAIANSAAKRLGLRQSGARAKGPAPHGHGLLVRLLPKLEQRAGSYLIEIGSTREKLPGQGSTVVLAELAAQLGLRFVTVDMDPVNTDQARRDMAGIPRAEAVTARGEEYLAAFDEPVFAAYLDAFDIDHGRHSAHRLQRYREILGAEVTNEASARMHLDCVRALATRVVEGGVIAVDDTWLEGGTYRGKGATAVPYLLEHGWSIIASTRTAVALQRPSAAGGG